MVSEQQVFSRDIIIKTLRKEQDIMQPDAERVADAIIQALAKEHLHTVKAQGLEIPSDKK
jgi:hypothetical protein